MCSKGVSPPVPWKRSIASRLLDTCNLARMALTWLRTVTGEITSTSAICWLDRPFATSSSTSRSRVVRCSKLFATPVGEEVEHATGKARTEHRVPGSQCAYGADRLARRGALDQVAAGTGPHRCEHAGVLLGERHDEHRGPAAEPDTAPRSPRCRRHGAWPGPSPPRRGGWRAPGRVPRRRRCPRRRPRCRRGARA